MLELMENVLTDVVCLLAECFTEHHLCTNNTKAHVRAFHLRIYDATHEFNIIWCGV